MNEIKDMDYLDVQLVLKLRRMLLLKRWAQVLEDWKRSILDTDTDWDFAIWRKSLNDWRKSVAEYAKEKTYDT